MSKIINFVGLLFSKPLVLLYEFTGSYGISIVLFLFFVRLLFVFFDYFSAMANLRSGIAKPYLSKIKDKCLGKDSKTFENCSLEIFNATGSSQISKGIPILIEYPVLVSLFFVVYNPISVFFRNVIDYIPQMYEISKNVSTVSVKECQIISAVKISPGAFSGLNVDLSGIQNFNSKLFGFDVLNSANIHDPSIIIPIITLLFFVFNIARLVVPVIRGKVKFKSVLFFLVIYTLFGLSLFLSAFKLPIVFHIYFIIFNTIGLISRKIIDKYIYVTKKAWSKSVHEQCREIMKKYNLLTENEENDKNNVESNNNESNDKEVVAIEE